MQKSTQDVAAAKRAMEFSLGWFAEPVYLGDAGLKTSTSKSLSAAVEDYPECMKKACKERRLACTLSDSRAPRLPAFSAAEKKLLRGSSDFFGLRLGGSLWA